MSAELTQLQTIIANVAHHVDAKRWTELRALYADQVDTDYTSLFGGTPLRQAADALIGGWRTALARVATQHLLGPIEIELRGAAATARCHVRAMHFVAGAAGGESWEVLGHYVFALARGAQGWKIAGMTLETFLQLGNPRLLQEAAETG
jgi:hypothetical protein